MTCAERSDCPTRTSCGVPCVCISSDGGVRYPGAGPGHLAISHCGFPVVPSAVEPTLGCLPGPAAPPLA